PFCGYKRQNEAGENAAVRYPSSTMALAPAGSFSDSSETELDWELSVFGFRTAIPESVISAHNVSQRSTSAHTNWYAVSGSVRGWWSFGQILCSSFRTVS